MKKIVILLVLALIVTLVTRIKINVPSHHYSGRIEGVIQNVEEFRIPPTKYGPQGVGLRIKYHYDYEGNSYTGEQSFNGKRTNYKSGQKILIAIDEKNPSRSIITGGLTK